MADEIRIRAALSWAKSGSAGAGDSGELSVAMTGSHGLHIQQTVGTVEEALLLGDVPAANAHYWIRNKDATNPVHLKSVAGAAVCTQIGPGRVAVGQFGSGVTVPVVQAVTAAVEIDVVLVQV